MMKEVGWWFISFRVELAAWRGNPAPRDFPFAAPSASDATPATGA